MSRKWVPPKNSTPQVFSAGKSGVWGLSFWTIMAMHGVSLPRRRSCAGILQQSLSTDEPRKGRNSCLRLRPRSVLGSFGVVLMSCKVNFHIVRSALQISVCLPTNPTSGEGTRDAWRTPRNVFINIAPRVLSYSWGGGMRIRLSQYRKWSQNGLQMILDRKLSPTWTANDPKRKNRNGLDSI